MGLAIGLDTAVKALRAHQLAVDVAAHNIANAHSPGFSRQRVLLRPIGLDGSDHWTRDAFLGRPGYGVDASDVRRVRDLFLDFQLRQTAGSREQYAALAKALRTAELAFDDPSDLGLSSVLASFWNAWHDVVNTPESNAARTALVHSGETLAARIRRAWNDLDALRKDLNQQLVLAAQDINAKAEEIARLNFQIKQVELNGDSANDLRDRRDLLLDELAAIAQISVSPSAIAFGTQQVGAPPTVQNFTVTNSGEINLS
ncbi:MAG: flagellar hook-associated protein FlgK, partial [Dehalococcoidia bacterium]|nr:flagellar hook-associated protein FlgK [Dehalococcoidia bacterium]